MHHTFFQEIFEFINKSLCYRYVIRHIFFIIRFVRWEGYTLLYNYHPNRDRSHKRPGNRQGHEEGAEGEAVRGPADTPTGFGKEGQEGKNKYAHVNFDSFCTINAPAPRFSALMGGLDEVHPSSGRCILGHSHQEF